MSRLMLNLHERADVGIYSSDTVPATELRFNNAVVRHPATLSTLPNDFVEFEMQDFSHRGELDVDPGSRTGDRSHRRGPLAADAETRI